MEGKKSTRVDFPENILIHQFFEQVAARDPERIAIKFRKEFMTYGELNKKANQVANKIRSMGAETERVIGLAVERSFEMVIGILAILKAGCAYLPIHPQHPESRIRYYLENSQVSFILILEKSKADFTKYDAEILTLDCQKSFGVQPFDNPDIYISPKHLAYVIYTSGSTGQPKGVMIEHKALLNRLWWMQRIYQLEPSQKLLQKTTFTFDVSVWELLWWCIPGASLIILEPNKEKDPRAIVKIIEQEEISIVHFVPSILEFFLEYASYKFDIKRLESLRYVIVSGEILTLQTAKSFYKIFKGLNTSLWNLYGPTEATIDVTAFNCDLLTESDKSVPIGTPIDNIKIMIANDGKEVADGEKGEIWIGGVGVAKGYINNPNLTDALFIEDPNHPESRIYKTGDIGRWNQNGLIEYHGRMDSQIKLRGLRIELGEIESQLMNHKEVIKCKVLVCENTMTYKFLAAFYQSDSGEEINALGNFLVELLPEYMIPSKFIKLDSFPVNENGKVDQKKLLETLY